MVPLKTKVETKMKKNKLTPEELLEVLEAHQDMLLGWIHFKDKSSHLVDVESLAVNGNAVQIEVAPFETNHPS